MKQVLFILLLAFNIAYSQSKKAVMILDQDAYSTSEIKEFREHAVILRNNGWVVYEFYSDWNKPSEGGKVFDASNKNLIKYAQGANLFIYKGHGNSDYSKLNDTLYPYICGTENERLNLDAINFKKHIRLDTNAIVIFLLSCTTAGSSAIDMWDKNTYTYKIDIGFDEAFRRVMKYRNFFSNHTYIATQYITDVMDFILNKNKAKLYEVGYNIIKEERNGVTIFKNPKTKYYFRAVSVK